MKQQVKQYFQYSRRERNGIFLLLFVLIGVIVATKLYTQTNRAKETEAQQALQENFIAKNTTANNQSSEEGKRRLKPFNPNTYTKDSLVQCGLSEKLAQQIINYRNKGGFFKTKKDFAKLYYLSDSAYKTYLPYLLLPDEVTPPQPVMIELNTADSIQLLKVKGIGPVYAHKIMEYKRNAGGFYTLDQLGEAFYINANTLQEQQQRMNEIKQQLRVDSNSISKININTASQKQLSHHPYISYKQSKKIISLIKKRGEIRSWEVLDSAGIFSANDKMLLHHYLRF